MADTMETTQAPASGDLRQQVEAQLATCRDPEIGLDIMSLGLVYELNIDEGNVLVKMTLTAPNCPVADILPSQVKQKILSVDGVTSAQIDLVFDPPWDRDKMSDAAKLALGFDLDLGRNVVPLSKLQR